MVESLLARLARILCSREAGVWIVVWFMGMEYGLEGAWGPVDYFQKFGSHELWIPEL